MCRWIYFVIRSLFKLETSAFNHLKFDICISTDIKRCNLAAVCKFISRRQITYCNINLHIVCYMYTDTSSRPRKYVDVNHSTYIVICRYMSQLKRESRQIEIHRNRQLYFDISTYSIWILISMCRYTYVWKWISTTTELFVVNYLFLTIFISIDVSPCDLLSLHRYVS